MWYNRYISAGSNKNVNIKKRLALHNRPGEVINVDEEGVLLHVEFVTIKQQLNEIGV